MLKIIFMQKSEEVSFKVENELPFLDPVISEWFNSKYTSLTEPQKKAIPLIHQMKNVLVSSPTGTGKTMTGFLSILNELFMLSAQDKLEDRIYCVYISPLKALANDIDKNLRKPLDEINELVEKEGKKYPKIRVGVRSGDTPQSERQKMLRKPPHIIITTPESFSLALSAPKFREKFNGVRYVILDEIHEISATKRGALLSVNLERLQNISTNFVRIGLSATQAPIELIASYLTGYEDKDARGCEIITVDTKKFLDLKTITPVQDLTKTQFEVANDKMYDMLASMIQEHETTLVFTNTRSGAEHVAMRLKARGVDSIEAHHSSLGRDTRFEVENKLKAGELRCVITSTSLELGIDIGYIDLVVQINSPKSVSKGLQRIGRSGHGIDELSKGRFLVFNVDDLMECAVLTKAAYDQNIDRVVVPTNSLDVLSQVLVGMSLEKVWGIEEAYSLVRNSFTFHTLDHDDFMETLRYLGGKIEDSTIYSKIWLDEDEGTFGKKRSTRMIYFMNIGTIPEEADYQVISEKGRHLGQLSDKFVERLKAGDIFVLGAKTYMFLKVNRNRVSVKDATGMRPTVPSWTGEMLPRSYDLGVLVGQFRSEVARRLHNEDDVKQWLMDNYHLDEYGANSLISYIGTQENFDLPTDSHLLIEGYVDKDSFFNIIYHIPLGRRVNDALSRAYAHLISNKYGVNTRVTVTDDGFMLTTPSKIPLDEQVKLLKAGDFEEIVRKALSNTEVFKQRFRHCAARSLMVLRKYKGYDISVVRQQLRSDRVLSTLDKMKNFPVIKETYHEITTDMMDVPRARDFVRRVIEKKQYSIRDYSKETSPFSFGIIFAGVSDLVLMEDRSRILKELQSKILDKIYGSENVKFLFSDPKVIENYYSQKAPRVEDEDSYEELLHHFPYIDPFKNRVNSPFPYATGGTIDITADLIRKDRMVSVSMRGTQWVHIDLYNDFATLFKRELRPADTDEKILEQCTGKSFGEIKEAVSIPENDLKDRLNNLEAAYLVRKRMKHEHMAYVRNDIPVMPEEKVDAAERLLSMIISSYGPLTEDELLIKLPADQELVEEALQRLVTSGQYVYDYITPVFVKQYMLNSDLQELLGGTQSNISEDRVRNFTVLADDVDSYFERYGFAMNEWDIRVRVKEFSSERIKELMDERRIVYGKIIKHKLSYTSIKLADALYNLRYDAPSDDEKKIMSLVEEGFRDDTSISDRSGFPKKVVRQLLKSLEYRLSISRDTEGKFDPLYGLREPERKDDSIRFLVDKYGPVTAEELSRTFWIYARDQIDKAGLKPVYFRNSLYYGQQENVEGSRPIIVRLQDPVSLYLGRVYEREVDFNARLISRGSDDATFTMEQNGSILWVENLVLYSEKSGKDLIEALSDIKKRLGFTAVVVTSPSQEFSEAAVKMGFSQAGENLSLGESEISDYEEEDLFRYAYSKMSGRKRDSESIYNMLREDPLGLRTEIEANYIGLRNVQLNNYYQSRLVFNFLGPYGVQAYAPLEVASIYRAIRDLQMDSKDQIVLRAVLEGGGQTENEIYSRLRRTISGTKLIIKKLIGGALVAKDFSRRLVFVPEKYGKEEAVSMILHSLLSTFGFFDEQRYRKVTGAETDEEFTRVKDRLLREGSIRSVISRDKKIVYVEKDFKPVTSQLGGERVASPKDLITLYFQDYIKSRFGTLNMYFYMKGGVIETAFQVRKNQYTLRVTRVYGENKYREKAKKELNSLGYAVIFP